MPTHKLAAGLPQALLAQGQQLYNKKPGTWPSRGMRPTLHTAAGYLQPEALGPRLGSLYKLAYRLQPLPLR
jgi:hypothetical protein